MLDKFARQLKPGDKVTIHAEVVALYPTEPLINLKLRLLERRMFSAGSAIGPWPGNFRLLNRSGAFFSKILLAEAMSPGVKSALRPVAHQGVNSA